MISILQIFKLWSYDLIIKIMIKWLNLSIHINLSFLNNWWFNIHNRLYFREIRILYNDK